MTTIAKDRLHPRPELAPAQDSANILIQVFVIPVEFPGLLSNDLLK